MAKDESMKVKVINQHGPWGFFMFVAFIGAFVYFLRDVEHFGDVIFAFFEAIVWPGILVYHVLQNLGA